MEKEMNLAVHQPNYLPWPGYFVKLVYDLFKLETKLVFLSSLPQFADLRKNDLIVSLPSLFC